MRQVIIARKDLNMSPGKLAAQCCHASMAFLTNKLNSPFTPKKPIVLCGKGVVSYHFDIEFDTQTVDDWICGIFTKTICEAKNKNQLLKSIEIAQQYGLKENKDFFLIKDACLTELEPEEVDENGVGRVLTCIGFRPLPDDIAHKISKKYQLYR